MRLLMHTDLAVFPSRVISLHSPGPIAQAITESGINVYSAHMNRPGEALAGFRRLVRLLRRDRPDIIQTWLYHGDLAGGIAGKLAGVPHVVWGLRGSDVRRATKRTTRLMALASARLAAHIPSRVVCCAESVRQAHVELGYAPERMVVIRNGFLVPKAAQAWSMSLRHRLGLDESSILIGTAGRHHPVKDHPTLLRAMADVFMRSPDTHLLLCGQGMEESNSELLRGVIATGRRENIHLLGVLSDMDCFYAAIDILCSSSAAEGLPNVVGEAMSYGVPVVATDVGDTALLLGDTGRLVPPADPRALASALLEVLCDHEERQRQGELARQRIIDHFSMERMVAQYAALYESLG